MLLMQVKGFYTLFFKELRVIQNSLNRKVACLVEPLDSVCCVTKWY